MREEKLELGERMIIIHDCDLQTVGLILEEYEAIMADHDDEVTELRRAIARQFARKIKEITADVVY